MAIQTTSCSIRDGTSSVAGRPRPAQNGRPIITNTHRSDQQKHYEGSMLPRSATLFAAAYDRATGIGTYRGGTAPVLGASCRA